MLPVPALVPWLIAAPPPPPPHAAPGGREDARLRAPEVTVHGYRIVVERIGQQQGASIEFPLAKDGTPTVARHTGRQSVSVHLAVYPPDPKQINQIDSLSQQLAAYTAASSPITLRSFQYDETSPELAGAWRAQVVAQELDPAVHRLQRLHGELVVYPRAQKVALDLLLAGKVPLTVELGGLRATLKQVREASGSVSVVVETQYAAGLNVSYPNPEVPGGITAVSRGGTVLLPGSNSMNNSERNGMITRQSSVAFTDLRELPAKIRVEALVRTGTPQKLPFTFAEVPLPDTFETGEDADGGDGISLLDAGHPLYSASGGSLVVPAPPGKKGHFLVGLSRQESGGWGAWRWVEVPGSSDHPTIAHLRPGRYRVARARSGETGAPAHPQATGQGRAAEEVEITAHGVTRLPAGIKGEN